MRQPPILPAALQSFTRHIAMSVFRGEMDYFQAEYNIASLCAPCGVTDYDSAFDLLVRFISRYEAESIRQSRSIRAAVAPLFNRHVPAQEIKQTAISLNKNGLLTPAEIGEILKSEYDNWKSRHQAMSQQTMAAR